MLRVALTPRGLGAALGVLLVIAVCAIAGRWQWDRTQDILAAERAAAALPVPIEQVLAADATELSAEVIGRPVTVSGEYDPARQAVVVSRAHEGGPGVWIVTGLRLDDGTLVAVLRGSLARSTDAGARVPAGPVTVDGVIQPDESFYATGADSPAGLLRIDSSDLAQEWGTALRPGYVTLLDQRPSIGPAPVPVEPSVRTGDVPFPLQNVFYAFQWWIFAAFAVALYLRWLWLESRRPPVASA